MFDNDTKTSVSNAINSEYENAVETWGNKYNSLHEGYAVLKEEVEESETEMSLIKDELKTFWDLVKFGETGNLKLQTIDNMRRAAERLALEAVQVAAVCMKIQNGL